MAKYEVAMHDGNNHIVEASSNPETQRGNRPISQKLVFKDANGDTVATYETAYVKGWRQIHEKNE